MALADRIFDTTQLPTFDVRVGGVPLLPSNPMTNDGVPGVVAIRGQESFDAPVPTIDLELSRIPTWMKRGMAVTIDAGYSLEHTRLFTGGVLALGDENPDYLRTQCFAIGRTDEDGVAIEATASAIDTPPIWPPIPAGQFIDFSIDNHLIHDLPKLAEAAARELSRKLRIPRRPSGALVRRTVQCVGDLYGAYRSYNIPARDLSGQTVENAIAGVLTDSGIAAYSLEVPAYTLNAEGATLERMPGAQMLDKLMQIDGCKVQQLPSGVVVVSVVEEQPGASAAFTYSTTDQATARIVDATGELQVPFNPLLRIGQTIGLDIEHLGINGRFFLWGHRWEISESGAWSYLDLQGGDDFGGTVGLNPIAAFTVSVAKQVIGDDLYFVITVTDQSFDLDGEIDQAASTWSSNHTTIPDIADFNGQPVATVRIAVGDVTPPFEITRTVVDNDALPHSRSVTQELDLSGSLAVIPPIAVAAGTTRMVTPNGGEDWNDTAPAAKTATAVGARLADGTIAGHFAFGHSDGSIDLTTDFGQTVAAALAAVGSEFKDVVWDWRDRSLVWALTDNCKLYLSNDFGVSFFLLADLRTVTYGGFGGTTPAALGNIIGLPAGGGVHIFGGDGAGRPMHIFNTNPFGGQPWIRVTFTGDLLTDTPADNTMRIVGYAAPGYGGETMILSWASGGGASLVAIYHTNDPIGLSRSFTRATGLTAGLKNGRVIMESGPLSPVARIAMFGDRNVWQSADGIAYTQIADVLPAGFSANHGLFASSVLAPMAAIYEHFLAVEDATGTGGVMKSTDEGETWNFLRPATGFPAWPAGAKAKKLALGAPGSTVPTTSLVPPLAIVLGGSGTPDITFPGGIATWQSVTLPSLNAARPRPYTMSDSLWFVLDTGGFGVVSDAGVAKRSVDGGATWGTAAIGDETQVAPQKGGITVMCKDAAGNLWGARQTGSSTAHPLATEIYKSDAANAGADGTWVLKKTVSVANAARPPLQIVAHPTNQNIIALSTVRWFDAGTDNRHIVWVTNDGGATWTENAPSVASGNNWPIITSNATAIPRMMILPNGRFIFCASVSRSGTWTDEWWISDDQGATRTRKKQTAEGTGSGPDRWLFLAGVSNAGTKIVTVGLCSGGASSGSLDVRVTVSNDSGNTWQDLTPVTGDPRQTNNRDAWYDPTTDALYATALQATKALWKLTPVSNDGEWIDVTNGVTAGGSWRQVALIPQRYWA